MMMSPALPGIKRVIPATALRPAAWMMVMRLIAGFVQHWGKMSATQAAEAIRTQSRHRANVGRCLVRQTKLDDGWLLNRVARRILMRETKRRRPGEWFFLVDQTFVGQQGQQTENTFSRANYRPRVRHSDRRQRKTARHSCHCFVAGLLLTPGGARIPCFHSYFTRSYCIQVGRPYLTQTELAADLIRQLPLPPHLRVLVLGDTAFDAAVIRAACAPRNYSWIVPLNPERVLEGTRPRPKVSSLIARLRAHHLKAVRLLPAADVFAAQRRVARCRQGSGCTRTFYVHGERRRVRRVGDVLLVFSTNQKPLPGQKVEIRKLLMTNDPTLDARQVVQRYDLRWQIELFFKELKSTLGLAHYRFRQFVKIERWVTVCLLTFLYLEWYRLQHLRRPKLPAQRQRWWRAQRTYGLCRAVQQHAEADDLRRILTWTRTPTGLRRLRRTLRDSHALEYRQAPSS